MNNMRWSSFSLFNQITSFVVTSKCQILTFFSFFRIERYLQWITTGLIRYNQKINAWFTWWTSLKPSSYCPPSSSTTTRPPFCLLPRCCFFFFESADRRQRRQDRRGWRKELPRSREETGVLSGRRQRGPWCKPTSTPAKATDPAITAPTTNPNPMSPSPASRDWVPWRQFFFLGFWCFLETTFSLYCFSFFKFY